MKLAGRARLRRAVALLGGLVVASSLLPGPAQAAPAPAVVAAVPASVAPAAVAPCSAGYVALTFDDGPSRTQTPRLVKILRDRRVPATFFMVGSRVDSAPAAGRLVAREGFVVANHTWSHPQLPSLSDGAIRKQLVDTGMAFRRARIPHSRLMRPPYGAVDARVRRDIAKVHLTPVLWTVDSRDWTGGTSGQIADRILHQLRRHQRNVVLQHDGINNSPSSVGAVPIVIRKARQRGFCFADLDDDARIHLPSARSIIPRLGSGAPSPGALFAPAGAHGAGRSAPSARSAVRVGAFDPWFDLR